MREITYEIEFTVKASSHDEAREKAYDMLELGIPRFNSFYDVLDSATHESHTEKHFEFMAIIKTA